MAEAQTEKAFQKQHLFQSTKARGGKKVTTKTKRWYKDVGLGFKTPTGAFRSIRPWVGRRMEVNGLGADLGGTEEINRTGSR